MRFEPTLNNVFVDTGLDEFIYSGRGIMRSSRSVVDGLPHIEENNLDTLSRKLEAEEKTRRPCAHNYNLLLEPHR
jgi:hypothetical protein